VINHVVEIEDVSLFNDYPLSTKMRCYHNSFNTEAQMLGNGAAKAPGVLMMKKGEVRQVGTWTFEAVASLSTARDPQCRTQSSNVDVDFKPKCYTFVRCHSR